MKTTNTTKLDHYARLVLLVTVCSAYFGILGAALLS